MSQEADVAKVKEVWGEGAGASTWRSVHRIHWTQHPKVQERLNFLVSGNPYRNRFEHFMDVYLRGRMPVARALTLGCGHGELERGLAPYNFATLLEGVDISDGAVAEATRLANDAGLRQISYRIADINSIELPKNTYDVIFGVGSIHHTARLEHLFAQVAESLKPGGFFFLDEYIGPSVFQWTDLQLVSINSAAAGLPARYRMCVDNPQIVKPTVTRPSVPEMYAIDPSEAVRSSEIVGLLPKYFNVLETKGVGGSLLHLLLEHIAGNFDENDPDAMAHLQSFFNLEDELIAAGMLQHDFAVIIAARR
jgi:SAM-dependent methyltransferase